MRVARILRLVAATALVSTAIAACGSSDSRDRNVGQNQFCAQGGPCQVGEVGPGGGIVVFGTTDPNVDMWEVAPLNGYGTYEDAVIFIEELEFGGKTGWELPPSEAVGRIREALGNFACAPETDCGSEFGDDTYWTADIENGQPVVVSIGDGKTEPAAAGSTHFIRPVRKFRIEVAEAAATTTEPTTTTTPPTTTTTSTTTTTTTLPPTTTSTSTSTTTTSTTTSTSTTTTTTTPPTTTTTVATVTASDAGRQMLATNTTSSCAVLVSGSVKCWGRNERGQLGNGESGDDILERKPVQVVGLDGSTPAKTVTQMASRGSVHNCALTAIRAVLCWGHQYAGQLGDGVGMGGGTPRRATPGVVSGFDGSSVEKSAVYVTTGSDTSCAIKLSGALFCWGDNRDGKAGLGSVSFVNRPRMVGEFDGSTPQKRVVNVSLGTFSGCAVTEVGAVHCWGRNGNGQLGDGTTSGRSTPVASMSIDGSESSKSATVVSVGHTNSCAVMESGAVTCWGLASSGAFGNSSLKGNVLTATPVQGITGLTPSSRAVSITTSQYHSCALMADGSVKCWGYSVWGQVGVGGTTSSPIIPRGLNAASANKRVKSISSSAYHTCVLQASNDVDCWGGTGALKESSQQNPQEFSKDPGNK